MARRKTSTTKAAKAKTRARRRKNPEAPVVVDDSSSLKEIGEFILFGLGGYAATRFLQRAVYGQLIKKFPRASKHVTALSGGASFLAAWYVSGYWSKTERYRVPISIGAGIAAAQTMLQTYVPKFGWIVSDFQPVVGSASSPVLSARQPQALPEPDDDVEYYDDDDFAAADAATATGDEDVVNPFNPGITDGGYDEDFDGNFDLH